MEQKTTPFLMFSGEAEEAINFYVSLLDAASIKAIERWGPGEAGKEGTIKRADFSLCGRDFMATDNPMKTDFTFTPSFSVFVDCENEKQIDHLFEKFSDGGAILMPLQNYPFSKKFAWVSDKFGVSWQLNLPGD